MNFHISKISIKLINLKIFGRSKVEQTFKYSINRLIKFTKCSACLIFPGTASVRKKKRNVVDNFPGILMDKMYHIVNILQTSEECFSSSNSIEIYCNGV